jgi:hypothetical protein
MEEDSSKSRGVFIRKSKKYFFLFIVVLVNIALPVILVSSTSSTLLKQWVQYEVLYKTYSLEPTQFTPHTVTVRKLEQVSAEVEKRKEEERKLAEFKTKVEKAEALLRRYNSVMQGYGELIVRRAEECGGDYRVIMAIAGNESGFGRIPYKLYNPFGYLDGVQYSGWEESLNFLSCRIAERFLKPCNNDLVCIINKYGGHDTDKEQWIRNIQWFINQL